MSQQLIFDRASFVDALKRGGCYAKAKRITPITSCVRLTTQKGWCVVKSTDMENTMRTLCQTKQVVGGDIDICIPYEEFSRAVNTLSDAEINMVFDDNTVCIKHSRGEMTFETMNAQLFPSINLEGEPTTFRVDGSLLATLVGDARRFTLGDPLQKMLSGIHLWAHDGQFGAWATNKYVMFLAAHEDKNVEGIEAGFTVSDNSFDPIQAVALSEDTVEVRLRKSNVMFHTTYSDLCVRLVEGNYPPLSKVVPKDMPYSMKISRSAVLESMTRIGIAAAEDNSVKLSFEPNALVISSRNYALNRAVDETIPCEHDIQFEAIGCNRHFITDTMRAIIDDNVFVELQAKDRPMIFRGENSPQTTILVMPIQFAPPAAPPADEGQQPEGQQQVDGE